MRTRVFLAVVVLVLGVTLSCKSGNQPPVVTSFSVPDTVYPGTNHVVSCTATDPESDPITLTWTCTNGTLTPDTGSSVNWHSPDSSCTAKVTVKARDSHNGEGSYFKDIAVTTTADRSPVISGITGPDSVEAGGSASLLCSASDPDADTLTYAWTCSVGGLSSQSGASVTWYAPESAASATVTAVVSDGQLSDTATKSIVVNPKPNSAPVIDSISGPSSLSANGNTSLTCFATDPDGDTLTYSWTCQRGRCTPATGRTVTWFAPDTSGNVIVTVTARDGRGGEDVRSKTIGVSKVTTTLLDTMVSVSASSYKAWYAPMKIGYSVWGSFSVQQKISEDAQDINFYVMDSTNFYLWVNNQSSAAIVNKQRSSGTSYSAVVPRTCRYYIVLDNTYSLLTPKIVTFSTKLTSP
jgi:hypothetical protein